MQCVDIVAKAMSNLRTYTELISLPTFEERFRYLRLNGVIGEETFGFDRYINQKFYRSKEWLRTRDQIILRDSACDLGIDDREIHGQILIHHLNPILLKDILDVSELLLNPEYLISTTQNTHRAIHYGDEDLLIKAPIERTANDTCPWKRTVR